MICSCVLSWLQVCVFFFKQKTAYEMRISDWSSDVCSSDLLVLLARGDDAQDAGHAQRLPGLRKLCLAALVDPGEAAQRRSQPVLAVERQIGRASCRERVCQYV